MDDSSSVVVRRPMSVIAAFSHDDFDEVKWVNKVSAPTPTGMTVTHEPTIGVPTRLYRCFGSRGSSCHGRERRSQAWFRVARLTTVVAPQVLEDKPSESSLDAHISAVSMKLQILSADLNDDLERSMVRQAKLCRTSRGAQKGA